MKKLILSIITFVFISSSSFSNERFYFGFEVSDNDIDTGVSAVSGASLDEDDTGYGIMAGFVLNENFDIEFGYRDFGEATLKGDNGDTFVYKGDTYQFNTTATVTLEGDSYNLGIKPKYNITDNVKVFGRLGIHSWESSLNASSATTSANSTSDGEDMYYGAGIAANFNNFVVEASYNSFEFDDEDVTSLTGFVGYRFTY